MSYRILPFTIPASSTIGVFATLGISPQRGNISFNYTAPVNSFGVVATVSLSLVDSGSDTAPLVFGFSGNIPDDNEVYVYNNSTTNTSGTVIQVAVTGYALFTPAVPVGESVEGPTSSSTTYTY